MKKGKRKLALLMAVSLLMSPLTELKVNASQVPVERGLTGAEVDASTLQSIPDSGCSVEVRIDSQWEAGYNATVIIKNTGDTVIENWHLQFQSSDRIENIWNASVLDAGAGKYIVKNRQWNQDIGIGESISFGYTAGYEKEMSGPCLFEMPMEKAKVEEKDYVCIYSVDNDTETALYNATFLIQNISGQTIEDWTVEFDFAGTIENLWNAEIVSCEGNHYVLKNAVHNQNIAGNSAVSFGFNGAKAEGISPQPENIHLYQISCDIDLSAETEGSAEEISGGEDTEEEDEETRESGEEAEEENEESEDSGLEDTEEETESAESAEEEESTESESDTSDSEAETEEDENTEESDEAEDIPAEDVDTDGDGIMDVDEERLGWDFLQVDSDSDGLPDGYELYILYPIVLREGMDETTGIHPEDDYDGDGLTNLEEYQTGSNPGLADTDGDKISDFDEIHTYGTHPVHTDTDGDGLNDGLEIAQGMNPLSTDSDGDGIPDGEETICQQLSYEKESLEEAGVLPTLSITGSGDYSRKLDIRDISANGIFQNTGFLVGQPYDFYHEEEVAFEEAVLTFQLSEEVLKANNIVDLSVAWYDEINGRYEFLDTTYDEANATISAEPAHFSVYAIINRERYKENLQKAYIQQQREYNEWNGSSYLLLDENLTWEEAQAYCESLGGHLAAIDSEEEQDYINDLIAEEGSREYYWLQEADTGEKLVWRGDSIVAYDTWKTDTEYYRYNYYSEQEYESAWLANIIYSYQIESPNPLFVFNHDSGVKNGTVPVEYCQIFAFHEKENIKRNYSILRNIRMERYEYLYTFSGVGSDIKAERYTQLYDVRTWEKEEREHYYLYGTDDYIVHKTAEEADGYILAYTVFDNDIPTFDNYDAVVNYFVKGDDSGQLNPQAVPYVKPENRVGYICEFDSVVEENYVLLENGLYVKLDADPLLEDETVDTDGDGIPDLIELGNRTWLEIPGTDKWVMAWECRSIPTLKDSDRDSLQDGNDPNPMRFDLFISGVYGNVIEFNTGNNYILFGQDIKEFYEQYYTREISGSREVLESLKRQLDRNRQVQYTVDEMVLLCSIDLNGVKDRLSNMSVSTKQAVYRGYIGVECSPEIAEAFFHVPTQTEVRDKFLAEFGNKLLGGKFEETDNILATYASLGLAFIGLDVPQDMRDLSYDILHWENSWEHVGETALDGLCLLPIVGILGKTDEALAIVKHSDKLYELRRITRLDDVLKTIGDSKYIAKSQELANTAMQKLQAVNPSIYRKILNYCDNSAGYRAAYAMAGSYSNPVTDTLIHYADDLEDISKVSNSLTREVVEEVAQAGSRNADNLDEVAEAAIESAKKRADEIVEGNIAKLRDTKNIRYSQDNIRGTFDDGTNVNELIYHLKNSPEYALTIEPIRLVKYNDLPNEVRQYLSRQGVSESAVFTLDNRRLYAAKQAGVKVNSVWATQADLEGIDLIRRFTTETAGKTIEIR